MYTFTRKQTRTGSSTSAPASVFSRVRPFTEAHVQPGFEGRGFGTATGPQQRSGSSQVDRPTQRVRAQGTAFSSSLPQNLEERIERLSGFSMDDVRVHRNSPRPEGVGALAYAQGTEIHLAREQEKHLPREAWHVVQQKQRRVSATAKVSGHSVNDSETLEQEANHMGRQAAEGTADVGVRLPVGPLQDLGHRQRATPRFVTPGFASLTRSERATLSSPDAFAGLRPFAAARTAVPAHSLAALGSGSAALFDATLAPTMAPIQRVRHKGKSKTKKQAPKKKKIPNSTTKSKVGKKTTKKKNAAAATSNISKYYELKGGNLVPIKGKRPGNQSAPKTQKKISDRLKQNPTLLSKHQNKFTQDVDKNGSAPLKDDKLDICHITACKTMMDTTAAVVNERKSLTPAQRDEFLDTHEATLSSDDEEGRKEHRKKLKLVMDDNTTDTERGQLMDEVTDRVNRSSRNLRPDYAGPNRGIGEKKDPWVINGKEEERSKGIHDNWNKLRKTHGLDEDAPKSDKKDKKKRKSSSFDPVGSKAFGEISGTVALSKPVVKKKKTPK